MTILALSDLMSGVSNYILAMTIIVSIDVLDKKLPSAVFHFSPECQNGELVGHDVLSTKIDMQLSMSAVLYSLYSWRFCWGLVACSENATKPSATRLAVVFFTVLVSFLQLLDCPSCVVSWLFLQKLRYCVFCETLVKIGKEIWNFSELQFACCFHGTWVN